MENGQNTKAKSESEFQAATSDDSTKLSPAENTESNVSPSSSPTTTAASLNVSAKTWTPAELAVLKSKIGLVAAALGDFQGAKGLVAVKAIEHPQGKSLKIILVAEGLNLVAENTPDGLDFDVSPLT